MTLSIKKNLQVSTKLPVSSQILKNICAKIIEFSLSWLKILGVGRPRAPSYTRRRLPTNKHKCN